MYFFEISVWVTFQTGFLLLVGLQNVTVMSFSANLGFVSLRPGGVMGPETARMARMKLAAVSEERWG